MPLSTKQGLWDTEPQKTPIWRLWIIYLLYRITTRDLFVAIYTIALSSATLLWLGTAHYGKHFNKDRPNWNGARRVSYVGRVMPSADRGSAVISAAAAVGHGLCVLAAPRSTVDRTPGELCY